MSILSTTNIGQSFGAYDVFSGVTVDLPNDGKVGLVGPNGVGKTTLLLILAGFTEPSAGSVHIAKGTRLGYLSQESSDAFIGRDHSVYAEMLTVFTHLRTTADSLRVMEAEMAQGEVNDELFTRYSALQEAFELAGGYDYELYIRQVLIRLTKASCTVVHEHPRPHPNKCARQSSNVFWLSAMSHPTISGERLAQRQFSISCHKIRN